MTANADPHRKEREAIPQGFVKARLGVRPQASTREQMHQTQALGKGRTLSETEAKAGELLQSGGVAEPVEP